VFTRPSSGLGFEAEELQVPPKKRGFDAADPVALDILEAVLRNTELSGRLLERDATPLTRHEALLRQEPEANAVADRDASRSGEFSECRAK
jgi:hypothetical protein